MQHSQSHCHTLYPCTCFLQEASIITYSTRLEYILAFWIVVTFRSSYFILLELSRDKYYELKPKGLDKRKNLV